MINRNLVNKRVSHLGHVKSYLFVKKKAYGTYLLK